MASVHYVLDNTLGAGLISVVVASMLGGAAIVQAWYYYTHQNDGLQLKLLVGAVLALDVLHQALISHNLYTYTVSDWGNPAVFLLIIWSNVAESIVVGVIAFLVQSFMALRVWRLSSRNKILTGTIMLLALFLFVLNTVLCGLAYKAKSFADLVPLHPYQMLCNALVIAVDVTITASLCFFLYRSRTGQDKSDTLNNKLIVFTINTGLFTSVFAIASLISIQKAGNTFLNMAFFWCIPRLYTNSLLATLNSRKKMQAMVVAAYAASAKDDISLNSVKKDPSMGRVTGTHRPVDTLVDPTKTFPTDKQLDFEDV